MIQAVKDASYKRNYVLLDVINDLGWTVKDLLEAINNVTNDKLEELSKLYSHKPTEQERYKKDRRKQMSRATLYNIISGSNKPSKESALLIRTAINKVRKSRNLKELSYEDIGIEPYSR